MARKRSVDPDMWSDDKVTALNDVRSITLYVGTISQADDFGRLEWSARQLFARLFPTREDVEISDVEAWMDDLARTGLVKLYEIAGRMYAYHPNWSKHQYVSRPSKSRTPSPTESAHRPYSVRTKSAQRTDKIRTGSRPLSGASESVTVSDMDTTVLPSATQTPVPPDKPAKPERQRDGGKPSLKRPSMPSSLPVSLPNDLHALKLVAIEFLAVFGNSRTHDAQVKHGPAYTDTLAAFRGRNATTAETWTAFCDALDAHEGKPLFGALAKNALVYLPNWQHRNGNGTKNGYHKPEPTDAPAELIDPSSPL